MGPMTFAALCAAHPRLCAVQSTPVKPVASQPAARPSRTLPDGGGPRRTRSSHRGGPGPAGQSKPAPSSTPTQQGGGGGPRFPPPPPPPAPRGGGGGGAQLTARVLPCVAGCPAWTGRADTGVLLHGTAGPALTPGP